MAKSAKFNIGELGVVSFLVSDCWMDATPWENGGKVQPYIHWGTERFDDKLLSTILIGPFAIMWVRYG